MTFLTDSLNSSHKTHNMVGMVACRSKVCSSNGRKEEAASTTRLDPPRGSQDNNSGACSHKGSSSNTSEAGVGTKPFSIKKRMLWKVV